MNLNGAIKIYRKELVWLRELTDQEYRMYLLFRHLAGWDLKNQKTFGRVSVTLESLREYLPWSMGKVSTVRMSLIEKGYLKWCGDGLCIPNFRILNAEFRIAERYIKTTEKNLLKDESDVRQNEIPSKINSSSELIDNQVSGSKNNNKIHTTETSGDTKETIKKEENKEKIDLEKERIRKMFTGNIGSK